MRLFAVVVACAGLTACAHRVAPLPDPAGAHRFEIVAVGDSTFSFLATDARWVKPGATGISVDPRRRDVLVARFTVQRLIGDTVLALVTGQTTRVLATHVALLSEPRARTMHQRGFWLGLFTGGALGAAAAIATR